MSAELPRRFGSYVLIAPLSRSSTSTVFLARSTSEARASSAPVVVKLHTPPLDAAATERARRRMVVASPHAPRLLDVGSAFVVLEHVAGWTLSRALEAQGGRWPVASAVRVAAGIARALGRLGTLADPDRVHGHVCPDKVILGADGRARLIGLDRPPAVPRLGFASPEQLADATLDPRADLYALAAILWRLLTGTPWIAPGTAADMRSATLAAEPRSMRALAPEVPARLDALVQTALAPDKSARFASADELGEALIALVPAADGPEPDVSELVGEALWSERESTRTILARAAESMMPFLAPGETFDGWDRPAAVEDTAANAARHTPVGAVRRFPATVLRRPDEAGTPRTDIGAGQPIPYAHTPDERTETTAPSAPPLRLRAPTFPGTWSVDQRQVVARVGAPTEELLENARVVGHSELEATVGEGLTWPMPVPTPAPTTGARAGPPRSSAPERRAQAQRVGPILIALTAAAAAVTAAVIIASTSDPDRGSEAERAAARRARAPASPGAETPRVGAVASAKTPTTAADAPSAAEPSLVPDAPGSARAAPTVEPRVSPRATAPPRPSPPPATPSASPSPPPAEASLARISALLDRARAAKRATTDAAAAAALDRTIGALVLEASAPDAPGIEDRLLAIEATIDSAARR